MKIIVAALASTFLISSASAQSPAPSASVPPSPAASAQAGKADARRDMRVDRHIKELRGKLKITAAEETQWGAVAKTMRDNASALDMAIDKREAIIHNATAIDDLNAYADIAQAHADAVKKLSAVFSPLYASMSDTQKKVADEVFAQRAHERKHQHKQ